MDPRIIDLQQKLLLLENAKPVSTATELCATRCCLCGDSLNLRSAHMYIGVKEIEDGKQIIVYDCKKCGQSGIMTPSLMHRIGINDVQVDEFLKSTNKSKITKSFSEGEDTSKIQYKYPRPTKEDAEKVEYLTNRLQIDFSNFENIIKYKVVLNFEKFLSMNNITQPQCDPNKIPILSQYGIGFISEDKTAISIRSMNREITGSRFNIIHLYPKIRHPFMYVPPCHIDVLTPYPKICIAESNFNITCVKNYFYGDDCTNVMFGSSSRKGCYHTLKRLMALSGFVGGKIEIYADNDDPELNINNFDIGYFDRLLNDFKSTFDISIIVSTKSKDMGEMPKPGEKFEYKTFHI